MTESSKGYRDLIVWQKSMDLVPMVYAQIQSLPKEERFGLADQIRRAAVSIPANIAEGQARQSAKEFLHFLYISRGSLAELDTLLELTVRLNYLQAEHLNPLASQMAEIRRLLQGLIKRLSPV